MNLFKNPKHAALWVPVSAISLIGIGALLSWPQFSEAKARSVASETALRRGFSCLVLPKGRLIEGAYYVTTEAKPDGKTYETLIGDGVMVCDLTGGTAQMKAGTAAYFRRGDAKALTDTLTERFGVDEGGQLFIPDEVQIQASTVWKPDFSKRLRNKPQPKQEGAFDWLFKSKRGN
jgi:hypothetical protein